MGGTEGYVGVRQARAEAGVEQGEDWGPNSVYQAVFRRGAWQLKGGVTKQEVWVYE